MDSAAFIVVAIIAIALQAFTLFLALFEPTLRYKIARPPRFPIGSERFIELIGAIADARVHRDTRVAVLTNGDQFYEAELEAIRGALHNINLEAYIFDRGELTARFLEALTAKAREGVRVSMVLDAAGCLTTWNSYFREYAAAGGRYAWYHPLRWNTLPRINNRTHRELLIVDGATGFLGGAGFADHWYKSTSKCPRWRDTMFKVEGAAVTSMQASFLENWLEATGELLIGEDYFPFPKAPGESPVLIADSSPSAGQSTHARTLYQTLLAAAHHRVEITTPYFLPDRGVRDELLRARERSAEVAIITPGQHTDHLLTRRSSRRLYGELLKAGAKIYEYQPAMIHTKSLMIDGTWCVVGSTNFDHRSFTLNDEVNLATCDPRMAERLHEDFVRDLSDSTEITYQAWLRRPFYERFHEGLGWILERQQ